MKNRFIAGCLVLLLIFPLMLDLKGVNSLSYAATLDYGTLSYELTNNVAYTEPAAAKSYLHTQLTDTRYYANSKEASISIMRDYGLLVYVEPDANDYNWKGWGDYMKGDDGKYYYRYLGYNAVGDKVTNSLYPNLAGTTDFATTYMYKTWVKIASVFKEVQTSWFNINDAQAKVMLLQDGIMVQDEGEEYFSSLSVADVLRHIINTQDISILKEYTVFLTRSSFLHRGSVKLWHRTAGGSWFYRTLITPFIPFPEEQMTIAVDASCLDATGTLVFTDSDETKTVTGTATISYPNIDNYLYPGYTLGNYIENEEIKINGKMKLSSINAKNITAPFSIQVTRDMFNTGDSNESYTIKGNYNLVAFEWLNNDTFVGTASVDVPVYVTAGDVGASFAINWTNENGTEENVKDSTIKVNTWQDYPLRLVPDVEVYGDNVVTGIAWQMVGNGANVETKTGTQTQTVSYIINESKEAAFLNDGVVTFKMYVNMLYPTKTDTTYPYQIVKRGTVEFVEKEIVGVTPKPPVAKLKTPERVKLGDVFKASASGSYDPDGEIVDYHFYGSEFEIVETIAPDRVKAAYVGDASKLLLRVVDNSGNTDTTSEPIIVDDPFEAAFSVYGKHKEKYKIKLSAAQTNGTDYYPIDSYNWTITPTGGQSASAIVYETGSSGQEINVGFRESGTYAISLTAHSTCTFPGESDKTFSDTVTHTITIQPDEPPIAGLSVMGLALREPSNELMATIEAVNTSVSPDGDKLKVLGWYKMFDSDNDGDRNDENWENHGTVEEHISTEVSHVGDYYYYIVVQEYIPDDETLPAYFNTSNFLKDDSLDVDMDEQHCLVDNVAPVVSTTAEIEKEVDLVVITDESTEHYTNLLTEMNRGVKELFERNIKLNTELVNINGTGTNLISAGMKKIQTFTWSRWWNVFLHWDWYESYREGAYTYKQNPTMQISKISESRNGTVENMINFPTYPDAYAEITGMTTGWDSDGEGFDVDSVSVNVYNAPNDFLKADTMQYATSTSSGRSVASRSQSDKYWLNHNETSRLDGASIGRLDISGIDVYPSWGVNDGYVSDWIPGALLSETDGEYKVLDIDAYLSKYKDSANDKFLVFAIANGENFFMTDEVKMKLTETYGFKNVYFSINDFWGEFKPTAPDASDVRLPESGGLYALTEYGNEIYNLSTASDVYYNQSVSAEIEDYALDLSDSGFTRLTPKTSGTYALANRKITVANNNIGTRYETTSEPVNTNSGDTVYFTCYWDYHFNEFSSPPDLNIVGTNSINATGSVTIDGKTFNVANSYTATYSQASVIETTAGEVYYIAPKGTMSDAVSTFSYTKLDIDSIDAVYHTSVNEGHALSSFYYNDEDWSDHIISRDVEISFGLLKDDVFIVKDQSGKYVLLKPDTSVNARYGEYSYTTSKGKTYYSWKWFPTIATSHFVKYFNDLDDLTLARYDVTHYQTYGSGLLYTDRRYLDKSTNYFGTLPQYPYATNNGLYEYSVYTLVDENGDFYLNDKKIASNARGADANNQAVAYVDGSGKVYGKGTSNTGSLGMQGVKSAFRTVFNTPYVLNAMYASKSFSSIYDFTSQTPAYRLTARGVYAPIIDSLIESYEGYSTSEDIYIEVNDTIDIMQLGIDREGDPAYEIGIDVEVDSSYYDNTGTAPTLPTDLTQPFPIDQAGKHIISLYWIDNPVGSNEDFAEFRYRNKNNATFNVYVHRRPFAVQGYAIVPQGDGTFNYVATDSGSYDLDHSVSRVDKGVVAVEYYYKKGNQPTWTEYNGTMPLENNVTYYFAMRVQDLEGAWSDYDIVDVEINGSPFILTAGVDPPYPTGVPAGSTITITADVFTYKSMASVIANVDGTNVTLSKVGQDGMNSTYSASYTVPSTKADKDYYDIAVTATANDGAVRTSLHKLNVNTPINLTGDIAPYSLKKGQVGTITAQTSKYASSCYVDLFDGTAGQGRVWLNSTSVSGDLATWSKTYTFDSNMPEGVYNAVFVASTANGNSESVTDTFAFIPNQPPLVTIESVQPSFIYEGDDVTLNCQVQDPDLDTLSIVVEMSQDGGVTWTVHSRMEDFPVTHLSGQAFQIRFENVPQTAYLVRVTATDPLGEQGQSTATFSAEALSVTGAVHHTEKWNENRMLFNRAKTGSDDAPRPYKTFWPGEKLVLEGQTTQIDSAATTFCTQVRVHIEGKNGVSSLLSEKNASLYTGEMWTEEMLDWKAQNLRIVFEAAFSNGIVKNHTVEIRIDNSEPYWQHHKLF